MNKSIFPSVNFLDDSSMKTARSLLYIFHHALAIRCHVDNRNSQAFCKSHGLPTRKCFKQCRISNTCVDNQGRAHVLAMAVSVYCRSNTSMFVTIDRSNTLICLSRSFCLSSSHYKQLGHPPSLGRIYCCPWLFVTRPFMHIK